MPPEQFCDIMWAGDLHYKDHQCDFLAAYVAVCYTHQVCISWRRHNFCRRETLVTKLQSNVCACIWFCSRLSVFQHWDVLLVKCMSPVWAPAPAARVWTETTMRRLRARLSERSVCAAVEPSCTVLTLLIVWQKTGVVRGQKKKKNSHIHFFKH